MVRPRPVAAWPTANPNSSLAFSPEGSLLAFANFGVEIRRLPDGTLVRTLPDRTALQVAFSPDGSLLASGDEQGMVRIWQVASGQLVRTLHGHTQGIESVAFSPDGATLASGTMDGDLCLWDVANGRLIAVQKGDSGDYIFSITFSPDGQFLASGGRVVRVLNARTTALIRQIGTGARTIAFSPDGHLLATGGSAIRLFQAADGQARHVWGEEQGAYRVAFRPDGQYLAVADGQPDGNLFVGLSVPQQRAVELWRVRDGARVQTIGYHTGGVFGVAFSPDGTLLASGGGDATVRLWRVAPQSPWWEWAVPGGIVALLGAAAIWIWGWVQGRRAPK